MTPDGVGHPAMNGTLTLTQALQLVALAPCLLIVAYLLLTVRRRPENWLPMLYFIALACSFVLPLLPLVPTLEHNAMAKGALMLGRNLLAPLSFLLVMQFLLGTVPPPIYWLILALPLIGGSPFLYVMLTASEACLDAARCYSTATLETLYNIFSVALIFLLLLYKLSTSSARLAVGETERKHKYWLIVSLIALNLVLAGLDLQRIAGKLQPEEVVLSGTVIRIAFIYLVLTSIFAVFRDQFAGAAPATAAASPRSKQQDEALVEKINALLTEECLYREMGLTRRRLAERLDIGEHQASRIINAYFRKSFNELVNGYRVEEAKRRLSGEQCAITVIAFEVGFNSIASFNRVFKELAGCSPTEYRVRERQRTKTAAGSTPSP